MARTAVILAVLAVLAGFAAAPRPALALANPASVFCAHSGGRSEMLRTASGAELGVCILRDGEVVEEWAWFRAHHRPQTGGR
jgi:putative hemolysin